LATNFGGILISGYVSCISCLFFLNYASNSFLFCFFSSYGVFILLQNLHIKDVYFYGSSFLTCVTLIYFFKACFNISYFFDTFFVSYLSCSSWLREWLYYFSFVNPSLLKLSGLLRLKESSDDSDVLLLLFLTGKSFWTDTTS